MATRPPVWLARKAAKRSATWCSALSSITTSMTRDVDVGVCSTMIWPPGESSNSPERDAAQPSCHRGDKHRDEAVQNRAPVGEVDDVGRQAELTDQQRRGLGAL